MSNKYDDEEYKYTYDDPQGDGSEYSDKYEYSENYTEEYGEDSDSCRFAAGEYQYGYAEEGDSDSNDEPRSAKRKPKHKTLKIVLFSLLGLLLLVIGSGVLYINYLFDKIEYDTPPEVDESLVFEDFTHEVDTDNPDSADIDDAERRALSNFGGTPMSDPDIQNVLLIGRDTEESRSNSRSDVMVLVSINKRDKNVKLTSFQRDIYAFIPQKGYDKLNHAHSYAGPKLCIQTLEGNFHVKIDNYVSVNFTTFRNIVEILGGVDMPLTDAEAKYLKNDLANLGYKNYKAGVYTLNGRAALDYCRIRYIDSDRERTQRHRNMLNKLVEQHGNINLSQALELLDKCLPLVKTDFTKGELMGTMVDALNYVRWPRTELVMPIEGASNNATVRGMFVVTLDWATNVTELQNFIYGTNQAAK